MVRRRSTASWDESDARARPPRRGTRPRTKDRPAHDDAVAGQITTIDRGRYTCLVPAPAHGEPAAPDAVVVTAVRAREIKPSGVGKSTLVNELSPGAGRATSRVSDTTGKGRHTSTASVVLPLAAGGWAVDTPGIRSFGLAHVGAVTLLGGFADLAGGTEDCPRGCTHDEDECGLDAWVASGHASPDRLDSFRRLLRAVRGELEPAERERERG